MGVTIQQVDDGVTAFVKIGVVVAAGQIDQEASFLL